MKNKKTIFAFITLSAIATILFGFKSHNNLEHQLLTVRAFETYDLMAKANFMIIAYPDGTSERIELEKTKMDITGNTLLINENLNKIKSKGYKLLSTATTGTHVYVITTVIFEKE